MWGIGGCLFVVVVVFGRGGIGACMVTYVAWCGWVLDGEEGMYVGTRRCGEASSWACLSAAGPAAPSYGSGTGHDAYDMHVWGPVCHVTSRVLCTTKTTQALLLESIGKSTPSGLCSLL